MTVKHFTELLDPDEIAAISLRANGGFPLRNDVKALLAHQEALQVMLSESMREAVLRGRKLEMIRDILIEANTLHEVLSKDAQDGTEARTPA